ncbi:RagB/SusD family nutrient uptake outer membrane protein [Arcicella lustrica]|uniref:RagB/SusD family nutrient uptake outer membrane protein n=1 Tax=Arcicella lustrica TaxID=2984196 RepID=A0ABU5SFG4_9BACT|nr:RagB/SusD family nutrient uptake outer membrane protein [Arcicella sp. DC25W]MEA5426015.1 RagB/SusD family nutrient uptake outer membrane protein [Arcicella sp. DC25W]
MKLKNIFKPLALGLVLTASSCSDLLDVQPRQSIDSATALTSEDAIRAAVNGVYDVLQSTFLYGRDLVAIPEALADNGRATNKSGRLVAEYQNQATNAHFQIWERAYNAINQLNLILEALPKATAVPVATRDSFEGQASMLRALLYFELARCYGYEPKVVVTQSDRGTVPLHKKGVLDLSQIERLPRATIAETYDFIYSDLTNAIAKLSTVTLSTAYANKGAANALFSRVALYRGDYENAIKYANAALASGIGKFQTKDAYVGAWRVANHPESMFEIVYQTNENIGVNTSLQTTYTTLVQLGNTATTGGFGDLVPTAALLAAFEPGDVRRNLYERGTAGRGTAEIECTKFFGRSGAVNLDNIPVIRISEMYLNRAEAYALTGKETEALADVNTIRTRAGLEAKTGLTGQALINEIANQRRIEFAFEGHRFFDLKRRGQDIIKDAPAQNLAYTDFRILSFIPNREIQANSNLKQNVGY